MVLENDGVPVFFLTKEMKEHFTKTRDLLDSILETFEILEDQELMDRINIAETEIENENTISLENLKEDLSVD